MNQKLIYLSMLIVLLAASPTHALAQPISPPQVALQEAGTITTPKSTLTVDTDIDESDGSCSDGDCSLRDAIAAASPGDTIIFAGDYTIILGSTLEISTPITIDGSGYTVTVSGDDAVRVLTISTDTHVTIDSLVITDGSVTIPNYGGYPTGGGIMIEEGAVVTLARSKVDHNTASFYDNEWHEYYGHGGGIFNLGTLTVTSSSFSNNIASSRTGYSFGEGGAIYNQGTLDVTDSTFADNAGETGGAIYNDSGATLMVETSLISANSAPCGGAGIANRGTATVSNSTIANNTAPDKWCEAEAAGIGNSYGTMTVTDSIIAGNINESASGGGLSSYGSNANEHRLTVIDSSIYNNTTNGNGGGIYNWQDSQLTVINSKIYSNSAVWYGGGIFSGPNTNTKLSLINSTLSHNTAQDGGGLYNDSSSSSGSVMTMVNSTVVSNTATGSGGGFYNGDSGNATLDNSILWGNNAPDGPQIHNYNTNRPTISTSDIENSGGSGAGWDTTLGTDGGGNIDADPLFVDADGADDLIGTEDDNLHLADGSPAIDAGDNTAVPADTYDLDDDANIIEPLPYDLDNTPRFQDHITPDTGNGTAPIVDMGAYEHHTTPPTITAISDQITAEDTPTDAIPFTIGDLETDPSSLTVSAASDNLVLVPVSSIILGGTGVNRTVTITPAANQHGSALITITVSDGSASTSEKFTLTVTQVYFYTYIPLILRNGP